MLLAKAASRPNKDGIHRRIIALYDASVAFFHAELDEVIYIIPPKEVEPDRNILWRLKKAMYGTRKAAKLWQRYVAEVFVDGGWIEVRIEPNVFHKPVLKDEPEDGDTDAGVHGDDFMMEGIPEMIEKYGDKLLAEHIEITCIAKIGPGFGTEGKILKRLITWSPKGFTWRADPKHAQALIELANKSGKTTKPADTPGTKGLCKNNREALDLLSPDEANIATRGGGIATYLALDRPDICYATRQATRDMSAPKVRMLVYLHRIARYLVGVPELIWNYPYQVIVAEGEDAPVFKGDWHNREPYDMVSDSVLVRTDADWAGPEVESQKCTTGITIRLGGHLIDFISTGQNVVSLSSAESEFYATATGATHGLQVKHIFAEMSLPLPLILEGDSTSAHAIANRVGTAKLRHLMKKDLWIQDKVMNKELSLRRVSTDDNDSDMGTKHLDKVKMNKFILQLNLEPVRSAVIVVDKKKTLEAIDES